jgi:hypothetical protein
MEDLFKKIRENPLSIDIKMFRVLQSISDLYCFRGRSELEKEGSN